MAETTFRHRAIVDAAQMSSANELLLALNAGSSSLKFALFEGNSPPLQVLAGDIDRIGSPQSTFKWKHMSRQQAADVQIQAPDHVSGLNYLLERLSETTATAGFAAVGHRVVHGGPRYRNPQRVDHAMLVELRRITSFVPAHLPSAISLMEVVASKFPNVPQIACFDTAFHSSMPRVARLLSIPRRFEAAGVQRYGFHGLSYAYLMQELERVAGAKAAMGRVILAHLGNGASMAAVHDGRSVDTTMAFTPSAGLMMSTRTGDLDPGLIAFLARSEQMSTERFEQMVNHESGLLGVSETSSDMRDLLAREEDDIRAAEAVALFCYQAKKCIGAYAAALGGLDTLIFAGGIGEHAPSVRARICEGLGFLGIELHESRNAAQASMISADTSQVTVRVMRTDEEQMIARSVSRVLAQGAQPHDLNA